MSARICLGTAQLGLEYGIGNIYGKPSAEKAFEILDFAWKRGIREFDTAAVYGDSEQILNAWIASRANQQDVRIITKLPPLPIMESDQLLSWVESSTRTRLEALGLHSLEGLLLHRGEDLLMPGVAEALDHLVEIGLCRAAGISTYHPEVAERALQANLKIIQITYSILDRRFEESGFLRRARENKVTVYARSSFLQGLLLLPLNRLPRHMEFARPVLTKWWDCLKELNADPLTVALCFSLKQTEIDAVVLGVETVEQMGEILTSSVKSVSHEMLDKLAALLEPVEERVLLPYLWNM